MSKPHIECIVSWPFGENSYIVHLPQYSECVVIDPGLEPDKLFEYLDERRLTPKAILNTHGHGDHVGGNAALKRRWPDCPLVIGEADAPKLLDPQANLSEQFGVGLTSPPADVLVREGDLLDYAGIPLAVLDTPGHSAGHVVYLCKGDAPWWALVGDVLFQGSIGRHDFPDGSYRQLVQSIREKLFTLPDDTVCYCGHGPATTIGNEKRFNPFVGGGTSLA